MENGLENMEQNKTVLYQSEDGLVSVDVIFHDETFWLTKKAMGELFDTSKQNISTHLANIFKGGELEESSVVKEFLTTAADGKKLQYSILQP